MKATFKFAIVNIKVFEPIFKGILAIASPFTNCLVRTTMAPTQLFGATTPNTLPVKASAIVNCRINTGDTIDQLVEHIKKTVGKNVKVEVCDNKKEASPVSNIDSDAFINIKKSVVETFSDSIIVAPYPFIATSDSSYYHSLSNNVYRFTPLLKDESDANRIHGLNERITKKMLVESVNFFLRIYQNTCN